MKLIIFLQPAEPEMTMKLLENTFFVVVSAFILTLLIFYGMDQLIMAAQGLPLNLNMTPAQ